MSMHLKIAKVRPALFSGAQNAELIVSLIVACVVFPLAMAAVGFGWGVLVELLAGRRLNDALLIPCGLAAALVVAGTTTAFSGTAPATVTVTGVGAVVGIVLALTGRRSLRAGRCWSRWRSCSYTARW